MFDERFGYVFPGTDQVKKAINELEGTKQDFQIYLIGLPVYEFREPTPFEQTTIQDLLRGREHLCTFYLRDFTMTKAILNCFTQGSVRRICMDGNITLTEDVLRSFASLLGNVSIISLKEKSAWIQKDYHRLFAHFKGNIDLHGCLLKSANSFSRLIRYDNIKSITLNDVKLAGRLNEEKKILVALSQCTALERLELRSNFKMLQIMSGLGKRKSGAMIPLILSDVTNFGLERPLRLGLAIHPTVKVSQLEMRISSSTVIVKRACAMLEKKFSRDTRISIGDRIYVAWHIQLFEEIILWYRQLCRRKHMNQRDAN